jgi:hypothetical protein
LGEELAPADQQGPAVELRRRRHLPRGRGGAGMAGGRAGRGDDRQCAANEAAAAREIARGANCGSGSGSSGDSDREATCGEMQPRHHQWEAGNFPGRISSANWPAWDTPSAGSAPNRR